jgi:hypothetical protein
MLKVLISSSGSIQFVYNDELVSVMDCGDYRIKRASHVEPGADGWVADMAPLLGPILGPFKLRGQALEAELDWLNDHLFGKGE